MTATCHVSLHRGTTGNELVHGCSFLFISRLCLSPGLRSAFVGLVMRPVKLCWSSANVSGAEDRQTKRTSTASATLLPSCRDFVLIWDLQPLDLPRLSMWHALSPFLSSPSASACTYQTGPGGQLNGSPDEPLHTQVRVFAYIHEEYLGRYLPVRESTVVRTTRHVSRTVSRYQLVFR